MVGLPALRRDTAGTTPLGVVCFFVQQSAKSPSSPAGRPLRWSTALDDMCMRFCRFVCQAGRGDRIRYAAWMAPVPPPRTVHTVSAYCARTAVAVDRLDRLTRRERCSILCRGGCFESCRGPSIFVHPHLAACFPAPSSGSPLALVHCRRSRGSTRSTGPWERRRSNRSRRVDKTLLRGVWRWSVVERLGRIPALNSCSHPSGDQFQTDGSSHADRWYASSTKPLFRVLEGHARRSYRNALKLFVRGAGKTKVGRCDCF